MDLGLKDATAVVQGGTQGMGLAAAECFAEDGARVAVMARTKTDLDTTVEHLQKLGSPEAIGLQADITKREQVDGAFRVISERRGQLAGTLSGGEQQMLAIGRGLMSGPRLLMLDEPSLGLAPILVREVFGIIGQINARGVTVLLVEQNVRQALEIAHRGYVLETGRIVRSGSARDLLEDPEIKRAYLGM